MCHLAIDTCSPTSKEWDIIVNKTNACIVYTIDCYKRLMAKFGSKSASSSWFAIIYVLIQVNFSLQFEIMLCVFKMTIFTFRNYYNLQQHWRQDLFATTKSVFIKKSQPKINSNRYSQSSSCRCCKCSYSL